MFINYIFKRTLSFSYYKATMVTFEHVKECFESKGCKFLVTKSDFDKEKHGIMEKYKYIASCGHEHEVWLNVFKNRGTGIICPKCVVAEYSITQKQKAKTSPLGMNDLLFDGIKYVQDTISSGFTTSIVRESCEANMAIKPKNVQEDEWIMVHVKATDKPNRNYAFKCTTKLKNCLIICICNSDKKMWVMDGKNIQSNNKIAIGINNSKYDDFEVTKQNICETLKDIYTVYDKYTLETINKPITECQQIEYEYSLLRKRQLGFLPFVDNDKHALVYDFMINGYKIQEKVGAKNKNVFSFALRKNNGTINRKHIYTSYKKGDNDFYWFHIPDKKHFYIIPEHVLIREMYVDYDTKNLTLNPNNTDHWSASYLYDYTNLDKHRILALFNLQ